MKSFFPSFFLLASAAFGQVMTLMHPAEPMPDKRTVIWTPTFQSAWDILNKDLGGKPTKVDPPSEVMKLLDGFVWDADATMPKGSWNAWAGPATHTFVDEVNRQAAEITMDDQKPFHITQEDPNSRIAFAILSRQVTFKKAFLRAKNDTMDFQAEGKINAVEYFGIPRANAGTRGEHVRVLAYRPAEKSHAIQIECRQGDDTVVLYQPAKQQDFLTACSWLRTWRKENSVDQNRAGKWNDTRIHDLDEVRIPFVKIEVETNFTSKLASLRIYDNLPYRIVQAKQISSFRLHEKGASVEVRATLLATPFGDVEREILYPRRFYYDRPFFVFLWRDNAEWPYFGAWIGDSSTLTKVPKP